MPMSSHSLEILAPGLLAQTWRQTEAFGAVAWLWMHSTFHRDIPIHALNQMVLAAIRCEQFILAIEQGKPVAYMSWACMDEAAERRYLGSHPCLMSDAAWNSGERVWILDWIAPFGHTRHFSNVVLRDLFAHRFGRYLYHRTEGAPPQVKVFRGHSVNRLLFRQWLHDHPVQADANQLIR